MHALVLAFLAELRFRQLFLVTATLFVVDFLIPDLIPLVDELLLGALTLLFAAWKRDRSAATPPSAPPPLPARPPALPHAPDR